MSQIRSDGDLEDAQGLRDRRTEECTLGSQSLHSPSIFHTVKNILKNVR